AAEGLVSVESSGHYAVALEVNAETDFVARNADFQAFVREAAKIALNTDGSLEALAAAHFPGESVTVSEKLATLIATIGENMTLRRVAKLQVEHGVIASYVHGTVSEGLGRIGVLVALESKGDVEKLSTLGRQIAMHVAALSPLALDASGIDESVVAREKAILLEKHQGKPANVQDKIAESGIKTFFKEVTLLEQPFVHDGSKSVAQVLKEAEGGVGAPVKLTAFVRYALGEGIEKEESDFAAEVAATVAGQS
ncbi:MAG: translation elongation factor Ts, partial [Rhizobiales bacterium 12-66-7]